MFAALSTKTGELKLSANRPEFLTLAEATTAGSGMLPLDDSVDVTPYDVALARIEVATNDNQPGVRVAVDEGASTLSITGPLTGLRVFADNLRTVATSLYPKDHLHIEYYDEHFYLAPDSAPLVVERRSEA